MSKLIEVKNLIFEYFRKDQEGNVESIVEALSNINLQVKAGDFVSIVGANGSGKSTLAKNLNALLLPTDGTVMIDGKDTAQPEARLQIRQTAGMVFQNPDNQIVGTTVETDTAFGPENLGVQSEEIEKRVSEVLALVGLSDYRSHMTSGLSGGQKQKAAIAGVLAMQPKCMILDEATAMLDPASRDKIMQIVHMLNRQQNMTIIHVTHFMEEIMASDYVYAMSEGQIIFEGTPEQIFARPDVLASCRLEMPLMSRMQSYFNVVSSKNAHNRMKRSLSEEERITETVKAIAEKGGSLKKVNILEKKYARNLEHALIFHEVSYQYDKNPASSVRDAVKDISFTIQPGEFVGIAGHTGSGKSTLLQLMNGLLKPVRGEIYFNGQDIWDSTYPIHQLRQHVGLVFQYPEHQLFEETVYKDVVFGPYHMKLSKVEAEKRAYQAIKDMGLSESCYDLSPLALSGGQKRRVAIAGVLAMQPEFLVLDEPTAGLDPAGRSELMRYISGLRSERDIAIIMVSHSMEELAEYTDRLIVMKQGSMLKDDSTRACFMQKDLLAEAGLKQPVTMQLNQAFAKAGYQIQPDILKEKELLQALGCASI